MMSILEHLQRTFRPADAADIAVVAVFLYTFFLWFKSTATRQALIGIGVLAIVYFTARAFDLYMTATMFQTGLAFAAIAFIVVFQEDLRRSFERLASLGRLRRPQTSAGDAELDLLIELFFDLARKKTGALVALRGAESLDRHLRGGIAADARISKALLDSIFDSHSMGHDGAALIDRDRIVQFGARLPLSDNSAQIGARGTRHSAALGLSELSDALVIVVSEERGEVCVAERGQLEAVATPGDLKRRLEHFTRHSRPVQANLRRRLLIENSGLKVTAAIVACFLWFQLSFEAETVQKTFVVPIEYRNLPATMDIDDEAPREARITLTGFERAFSLMAPSTLKVSLDLSKIEEGKQQTVIDDSLVKLPSNLELFRSAPRIVEFTVHTWVREMVPVAPRTEGRLPPELRQWEFKLVPNQLEVYIWSSYKSSKPRIYTETIDLSQLVADSDYKAKLVLPQYMRFDNGQSTEVRVVLDPVGGKNEGDVISPGRK